MNPVMQLAREMQTPSAHFERSNQAAREILAELKPKQPACPRGMHEYEYNAGSITLVCHLDYEPAERGSRSEGLQQEPDYPAQMTLHAAYLGFIDVYDGLDSSVVEEIEELALGEQA